VSDTPRSVCYNITVSYIPVRVGEFVSEKIEHQVIEHRLDDQNISIECCWVFEQIRSNDSQSSVRSKFFDGH